MTAQNPSAAPAPGTPVKKTKWIVQLVVGTICLGNIFTMVFAILGLVKADTDLPQANKFYKWGWIAYIICIVLWIVFWIIIFATGGFSYYVETSTY